MSITDTGSLTLKNKPVDVVNDNGKFDLDRRRPYIIDYKTRNLSFLQTSIDLSALGIKHNTFMLSLFDRSLVGVDPHSPFLTPNQQNAILNECYINPWYFLREVVKIPDQGGHGGVPYQLNRANLASTWLYLLNIDHYLVIPRQTGKTISTVAALLWSFLFGTSSSEFMFINKSAEDAVNNLGRLKSLRDALPQYLRFSKILDDEGKIDTGKDNVKTVINPVSKNKIVTKPSASSVSKADNIGRGNTQPIQYYDEVEFTPFIMTIIQAAGPAFSTASRNARRNNASYCRVFTLNGVAA